MSNHNIIESYEYMKNIYIYIYICELRGEELCEK